jgi:predicted ATPase/transcriptional regulator with XRE-family HTH domain
MPESRAAFSTLLRQFRSAAALSQEELAERAGLSRRGISDLERGVSRGPRLETVRLLATGLALTSEERAALLAAARPAVWQEAPTDSKRSPLVSFPAPLTRLIGREADVMTLQGRLQDDAIRLLTLTGPGGVGKTRLAVEVASGLHETFPDGVVFADLTSLTEPDLVVPAVATALGIREVAGQPLFETLARLLAPKRVLLVLDNCERVLAAAPEIIGLLTASPGVTIIGTSREPFHVRGEHEFPVLPLPVPTADQLKAIEALAGFPSIALFVDRATAVQSTFALTADNATAVATICRRLDGLPLAIELAAARVKVLPPAALLSRLEQRLPLLTGGGRDLPARQRTMRATIAWSYDLLSSDQQALFRRLAVFVGGFTLSAAEAVAAPPAHLVVLDGIIALVEQSILRSIPGVADEPRYQMLETVREFGLEQLRQHGDEEAASRRAHSDYFVNLALASRSGLSSGVPHVVMQVRAEEDNLRATLTYLLESGDAETALRVAGGSLNEYWIIAGSQFTEARAWLDRALQQGAGASPAALGWAHYGLAMLALYQGDFVNARAAATQILAFARASNEPLLAAQGPWVLSLLERSEGRPEAAVARANEAVAAARPTGDSGELAWALMALAEARRHSGNLAAATAATEEALALFREFGGLWGETDALQNLGAIARAEGNLVRAAHLHAESLTLLQVSGDSVSIYSDLVGLAAVAQALGRACAAARLLGVEDAYRSGSGYEGVGDIPRIRQQVRQALIEQLGDAQFKQECDAGKMLTTEQAVAEALALARDLEDRPGRSSRCRIPAP